MKLISKPNFASLTAVFFFLVFSFTAIAVRAQETTPSPTPTPSEEERRLLEERRLIELQRDIELAKKAIRDAQPQPAAAPTPPAPTATPLAGDTTLENVKLESEMVAYRAMSSAAAAISREILDKKTNAKNIAIYDAQVIKDWRFYRALFPAFEGQVIDIRRQYRALLCDEVLIREHVDPGELCTKLSKSDEDDPNKRAGAEKSLTVAAAATQSAFAAGTNLLKSFIDLAALFRTDTKITGSAFTVDESAFVAEIFRAMNNANPNLKLYYPEVFPPRVKDPSQTVGLIGVLFNYKTEADRAIKGLNARRAVVAEAAAKLSAEKGEAEAKLRQVEALNEKLANLEHALAAIPRRRKPELRKKLRAEITDVEAKLGALGETAEQLKAKIEELKAKLAPLEKEIKDTDTAIRRLAALNERFLAFVAEFVKVENGVNALALFIKSEDIENAMEGDESYWLEIKSVSAGGNNRVRKNLLRFFTGPKLDHSGGVIVEYTLYDKTGAVARSDKLSIYEGYVEPKKIRDAAKFKKNGEKFEDKVP